MLLLKYNKSLCDSPSRLVLIKGLTKYEKHKKYMMKHSSRNKIKYLLMLKCEDFIYPPPLLTFNQQKVNMIGIPHPSKYLDKYNFHSNFHI